jgi:pyridoxamine 5'-phosphate oxidase
MAAHPTRVQFNLTNPARPFNLLKKWYEKAEGSGYEDPNGMTLATATPDGNPSARIVLLKQVVDDGLIFFTNRQSQKGEELEANPKAAVVLWWPELHRQIRVTGSVSHVTEDVSDAYFNSRPRGYRLGAWASKQSQAIPNKFAMEKAFLRLRKTYKGKDVPRPPHWGGYLLKASKIEFWELRVNRLHDRQCFKKNGDDWTSKKLYP